MHDIRFLKMNNTITIGVSGTPVLYVNCFISYLLLPSILVGHVRVELIGFVVILFSGIHLVNLRILMGQDMFSQAFVCNVARSMIAVMMRVDQEGKRSR